jgi:glutamine synthetase
MSDTEQRKQWVAEDMAALSRYTALVEAARFYMSQFGQALEANEIEYGPLQIEADERLRAAITVWEQSNG